MKLLIASNNKNKILEIENKFSDIEEIELISLNSIKDAPHVEETGSTFEENALLKAKIISEHTGMAVMSDDSGLEIKALKGKPGVYSARYGGENLSDHEKNLLILKEMKKFTTKRKARFVCVIALYIPGDAAYFAEAICEGEISAEPAGNMGFGYDPIFYLPPLKKTMAQLTMDEKNRISHRAIALEKAKKILKGIVNGQSNFKKDH